MLVISIFELLFESKNGWFEFIKATLTSFSLKMKSLLTKAGKLIKASLKTELWIAALISTLLKLTLWLT